MAKRRCQRCEREQTDAATLRHHCTRALKGALTHIARLWPHLLEAILDTVTTARKHP